MKTPLYWSVLALGFICGCRIDHVVTLYPDGSGKFTLSVGKREAVEIARKDQLLEELEGRWGGVVAWAEPVVRSEGGWNYLTLTGYFDDINSFRIWNNQYRPETPIERRTAAVRVEYSKSEDNHRLVFSSWKEHFSEPSANWKPEGGRFLNKIILPGPVKEASGVTFQDGRNAGVLVDDALMADLVAGKEEAKRKVAEVNPGVITLSWTKSEIPDDDVQQFKMELSQAKKRWKLQREEWAKSGKEKK